MPSRPTSEEIDKLLENIKGTDKSKRDSSLEEIRKLLTKDVELEELAEIEAREQIMQKLWREYPWPEKTKIRAINFSEQPKSILLPFIKQSLSSPEGEKVAELPNDFLDLLNQLSKKLNCSKSDIVKMGLIWVGLASKVKEQGFGIAVVDSDGSIVTEIEGF
jgi:hypothetical protein